MNKHQYACAAITLVTLGESKVIVIGGYGEGTWHASVKVLELAPNWDQMVVTQMNEGQLHHAAIKIDKQ